MPDYSWRALVKADIRRYKTASARRSMQHSRTECREGDMGLLTGGRCRWVRRQVATHERHGRLDCTGGLEVVVPGLGRQPELLRLPRRGEEFTADFRGDEGIAPAGHDQ